MDTDPYFHEPVDPDPDPEPESAPIRVNINTASLEELQEIVHIGEARGPGDYKSTNFYFIGPADSSNWN